MSYYDNNNEDSGGEPDKKSKYNAAISQIYRLDNLFQKAESLRNLGRLIKWNWVLDSLWIELASDSTPQDIKIFGKFTKAISKYRGNKNLLYQILMRKEIWLRKLQNQQGKGTSYIDDSEDDFD